MIYPQKPRAKQNVSLVASDAFAEIRKLARGEINFETACSNLGASGGDLAPLVDKYKKYADTVRAKMIENYDVADVAALKAAVVVTNGVNFKDEVIDDLIERETFEGTFDAFKTKYTA